MDELAPALRGQVDRKRAAPAIEHLEELAVTGNDAPRAIARGVAERRLFDLDHVGAHVGQVQAPERRRQDDRELEHPNPVQRSSGHRVPPQLARGGSPRRDALHATPPLDPPQRRARLPGLARRVLSMRRAEAEPADRDAGRNLLAPLLAGC